MLRRVKQSSANYTTEPASDPSYIWEECNMSQFDSILTLAKTEGYQSKKQVLGYLLHTLQTMQREKKSLTEEDNTALLEFAYSEVDAFLAAIPNAASYKEKDLIFECEDSLLGLIMHLCPSSSQVPQDVFAKIKQLVKIVADERGFETCLDNMFRQDRIEEADVVNLLSMVKQIEDEYQKGKLYAGLLHYKSDLTKLSPEAKAHITTYLTEEINRYLNQDHLTDDCINSLEVAADISKHFADRTLLSLLNDLLKLGHNNINYYTANTLLCAGQDIPADTICSLAQDLEYADLTYSLLEKFHKQRLFPKEYSSPEYLAKSDMVHWLMFPTELGKAPDEIEYIGKISYLLKKEVYYVFKYRSDSDTLGDDLKNKWLIGWSSKDGGTFSNFDEYAHFEKNTIDATLKNIKKKLIG